MIASFNYKARFYLLVREDLKINLEIKYLLDMKSPCIQIEIKYLWCYLILDSIVVSIPACHAGDRGSIPRRGEYW